MNAPVRSAQAMTLTPQMTEALNDLCREARGNTVPVTITQMMVADFTMLTGDDNPIHRADAPGGPITPGLLTLSLLPKLTNLTKCKKVADHVVYNVGVECQFSRPVPVGSTIKLSEIAPESTTVDRRGITAKIAFTIVLEKEWKAVAKGVIYLLLRPN